MARRPPYIQLLRGPYTAPAIRRGDRAVCLYRDAEVIVSGWSDGLIPWPRCRQPGTHGGGSGLLVCGGAGKYSRMRHLAGGLDS
jgi:hypothetical protein